LAGWSGGNDDEGAVKQRVRDKKNLSAVRFYFTTERSSKRKSLFVENRGIAVLRIKVESRDTVEGKFRFFDKARDEKRNWVSK